MPAAAVPLAFHHAPLIKVTIHLQPAHDDDDRRLRPSSPARRRPPCRGQQGRGPIELQCSALRPRQVTGQADTCVTVPQPRMIHSSSVRPSVDDRSDYTAPVMAEANTPPGRRD